ncbi:MAG: hypothetical protein ACRYFK_20235 [Janthinobacterium lividum]
MRSAIERHYQHCREKGCVQSCPAGSSHYEDPPDGCVRLATEQYDEERHFTVHTADPQSVTLVAIDKCLISQRNSSTKRCDCAFYTPGKIAFVEFKLRDPSRGREQDTRAHRRLEEAAEQLLSSILSFEQQGFITTEEVEAYAHVGYQQPIIPAPTTTLTNLEVLLNDQTQSLVTLFATNEATL